MQSPKNTLSASRIKKLQECSWKYYCGYVLKLPEKNNTGALMGSIAHTVFEVLGNPRHKHHYDKIIETQDVFSSPAIKRLVRKHVLKSDLNKHEFVDKIKTMILVGLQYDFFGKELDKPDEALSEIEFNIEVNEGDVCYKTKGFIDKLFLYKKQGVALIRDFKSSKKMFDKKDIEDNLQHFIYCLAVKKLYPEYLKTHTEFAFLQFMGDEPLIGKRGSDGIIRMAEISDEEHRGFELMLTEFQKIIDNFDEKAAVADLAWDKGFTEGFGGKIMCGKNLDSIKKDGTPAWVCPVKFGFEYYAVKDKNGKILRSYFLDDAASICCDEEAGEQIHLCKYDGCPAFRN